MKYIINTFIIFVLKTSFLYSTNLNFDQIDLNFQNQNIYFGIKELPVEIQTQIFSYLEKKDIAQSLVVSRIWNEIVEDQILMLDDNNLFYSIYRSKTNYECNIPDNDLKTISDIKKYSFDPHIRKNKKLLDEYIKRCICAKIQGGHSSLFYELDSNDIEHLSKDENFIKHFKKCLTEDLKVIFYDQLQLRVLNLSRATPEKDYSLGKPMLSQEVRNANASYVKQYQKTYNDLYDRCYKYVEEIKTTKEYTQKFKKL